MRTANLNTLYSRHSPTQQQGRQAVVSRQGSPRHTRHVQQVMSLMTPRSFFAHQKRLASRTSCASCYCYVYHENGQVIDHECDELCEACTLSPCAPTTLLNTSCTSCGDTLCPLLGHTSDAQRKARLCVDCFSQQVVPDAVQAQYRKPSVMNELEPCAVCLEPHSAHASVQLECDHSFHQTCITQWLHKCGTCPLCRQQVLSVSPQVMCE